MTTTEPKRTGRPPLTSREHLLGAAREHGFRDLSVGVVTRACGVKYSTYYRHFKSHAALIAALLDEALAEAEFPRADQRLEWRTHLDMLVDELAALVQRWPGIAAAIRPTLGTNDEPHALVEAGAAAESVLARSGIAAGDTETAINTILALALDEQPHRDGIDLVLDGLAARSQS